MGTNDFVEVPIERDEVLVFNIGAIVKIKYDRKSAAWVEIYTVDGTKERFELGDSVEEAQKMDFFLQRIKKLHVIG